MYFTRTKFNESDASWIHVTHCLDIVRQRLMCEPDVNFLAKLPGKEHFLGEKEIRRCKNFNAYFQWAEDHKHVIDLSN